MQIQGIGKRMNSEYMGWRGTVNYIYRQAGIIGFTRGFLACLGLVQQLNVSKSGMQHTTCCIPYARKASNMRSVGTSIELKKVRDIPAFGIYFYTYEVLVGQVNLLNTKSSGMIINSQSDVFHPIFHQRIENRSLFICFE